MAVIPDGGIVGLLAPDAVMLAVAHSAIPLCAAVRYHELFALTPGGWDDAQTLGGEIRGRS